MAADTNNHRLQVLSRSGEVRGVVGHGPGAGSGEFQQPTGLACDGRFLYVADSGNCRLHKLSLPEFKPVATIGSFGEAPGQLHAPVGLALHDDNRPPGESPGTGSLLFCADSRNHRIAVFTTHPELRFIRTFGLHGTAPGELGPTSSGIYLAAADGELVADRANHRLQVFSTAEGQLLRTIGQRGTAPGSFRRIRGVAVSSGRLITAECERVQVLSLTGLALQVMKMDGSSALVGICADRSHVCVVDQTHQKVRALLPQGRGPRGLWDAALRRAAPSALFCCRRPSATRRTRRSSSDRSGSSHPAARRHARPDKVRNWVRANITYTMRDKSERASETLLAGEGMCTNKANLQVALLRAAGIPAGFVLAHITKEAFMGPQMLDEVYEMISPVTVHVFCAAYIPFVSEDLREPQNATSQELGVFRHYDATERQGSHHLTEYVPYTDETRYRQRWLRGPFSPVQGNLDHLLTPGSKIPADLLERQNELYRAHPI